MKSPSIIFRDSLEEVHQLLEIHTYITGKGPGRRHSVEVLNKSAILFACAFFEAFIEKLATNAFDFIVAKADNHDALPKFIKQSIAKKLKDDPNEIKVWELAGNGWHTVAANYRSALVEKYIGTFNTPKPGNIESLLKNLIGFDGVDKCFTWKKMSAKKSKEKLKQFVELKGALAHGEQPAPKVLKADVVGYLKFLAPLSVRLSNDVCLYVQKQSGHAPWEIAHFGVIE